ncbi:Na+ dependent nucleoside transporter [Putridiphycobacter roseus]|uniref:Na+ dependent nucleoside transporter n=1 Tax=Putridiphycobacter roseus TaxID=2219161 RepID=A0A2W1N081_9FLAO|nr:nucleoside transporter C-terminal domain-containing protein [Putridiphycobacter roseus]PZE17114.1 Na+ dependent nucleoside transporter [Putridiphycobacter roseus]
MKLIKGKIRNPKVFFTCILFLSTLFIGCNNKPTTTIFGDWQFSDSLTQQEHSLKLIEKDGQLIYHAKGIDPLLNSGIFSYDDHYITFQYIPESNAAIDSIYIIQDPTGQTKVDYFLNKEKKFTEVDGVILKNKSSVTYQYFIHNQSLKIETKAKTYPLEKQGLPPQNLSFSSVLRGAIGILFLLFLAWLFSKSRKDINWQLVRKGLLLQIIIAIAVLKVPFIQSIFDFISRVFVKIISFTNEGVNFLFAQFGSTVIDGPLTNFAFTILPTIIFFSALVSVFYYYGILQKIIYAFAWVMKKFMHLSGAESLAAAGNVFLGQTEAPLLVKPYLGKMTTSEIMCLMTGGMATIAGGVLAAYVGFLGGDDPVQQAFFAKHLLTASIISAPAAIIAAKILVPETEAINTDLKVDKNKLGSNALEAISNGTTDGLKLAINVGAMLLVFIAFMTLGNYALSFIGRIGINDWISQNTPYTQLSFEFILGYVGRPIVWLIGVDWAESIYVGELLGTKTVLNEFVGYMRLGNMKTAGLLSEKGIVMSTYILCGFANFSSIGIQIGGIGALVPNRKGLLSKLGMRALIGGTIACLMTAAIVGMLY